MDPHESEVAPTSVDPVSGFQVRPLREVEVSGAPQPSEPSDAECVARMRRGDSSGIELLYRRHAPYVLSLAVRVQGNANDVEDVVHDSFVRAQEKIDSLASDEAFRGWLAAIVVSLVRTRLRRRQLFRFLGLSSADPVDLDALASSEASPEARAELGEVYRTLERVPVEARIAWTLRYVEGRKLEEVAKLTDCSLATAKRRLLVAREKLLVAGRKFAGADEPQEEGARDEAIESVRVPAETEVVRG